MDEGERAERGGITRLAGLIEEHSEALEADLIVRGIDLRELWRGGLSWRRLGVLIRYLPPESATKTALRNAVTEETLAALPEPKGHGPWSNAELLLAAIADGINVLAWQQTQINGTKKTAPPEPIRRPGIRRGRRDTSDAGMKYLAGLRERREASSQ